jgi:hypothetical protein
MRYRSITLNDNKKYQFSLIKYNEEYKKYLEELKRMNATLANSVEKCPTIYSELSDHQSYIIFSDEIFYEKLNCVGAIYIGTSTDEKNLEIQVQFIEEKFENKESIFAVLEQLVDTLGMYCFDKENIEIHLLNNIDLEKMNQYKYKKNCLFENVTTYTTTNEYNNRLFSKLFNEMSAAEQNLVKWKQCWMQKIDLCGFNDYHYLLDEQLIQEYSDGTIPLSEIFYKAESVLWDDINSIKSKRRIEFERNGQIHFTKTKKDFRNNYEFLYNILKDGFNLKKVDWRNNTNLEIDETNSWTRITSDNLKVVNLKEEKIKKVQYKSPVVNNSSISLELYINEQNEIERCYVDFITHRNSRKNKGKINGIYALRILSKYHKCTLNFISRKGMKSDDFADEFSKEEQLFTTILNGNLTLELIDELIKKMIPVVNRKAISKSKPMIAADNETIVWKACNMETEAINYVKQIKGEIPLPHLQENLEKFIEECDIKKNNAKKMVLKK